MVRNEPQYKSAPCLLRSSFEKREMIKALSVMKRGIFDSCEVIRGVESPTLSRRTVVVQSGTTKATKLMNPGKQTIVYQGKDRNGRKFTFSYTGGTLQGMPHGKGKYTFPGNRTLEGTWSEGKIVGDVIFTEDKSFVYVGGWKNGCAEGAGEFKSIRHKAIYQGNWQQGKAHLLGTLTIQGKESEAVFKGKWLNGTMEGRGDVLYPNGDRISGSWAMGRVSGMATYTFASGDSFQACWVNGLLLDSPKDLSLSSDQVERINTNTILNKHLTFNYLDQTQDFMYTTHVSVPVEHVVGDECKE